VKITEEKVELPALFHLHFPKLSKLVDASSLQGGRYHAPIPSNILSISRCLMVFKQNTSMISSSSQWLNGSTDSHPQQALSPL
jgi:hypothetical protein